MTLSTTAIQPGRPQNGTQRRPRAPLLRGFLAADGLTISVWCPFCEVMHQHGWPSGPDSRKPEHRVEHCVSGSPFEATGYRIAPWRPQDLPAPARETVTTNPTDL